MNIANRKPWQKDLDPFAEEKRKEEREKEHPLAAAKEDRTPENVLAAPTYVPENAGLGGGKQDDRYTLPSDTKTEAAETRATMREEANERLEAGEAERIKANQNSEWLFDTMADFAEKQDTRYDELFDMAKTYDYRNAPGVKELLYSYLLGADTAAEDAAASLAGENGGNGDSYSVAMAARAKKEYADKGDAAARDYYDAYLDRLLQIVEASGGDMNTLFDTMQGNVDTAQKAANTDLTLGKELLESVSKGEETERKIESDTFSALLKQGDSTAGMEVSPMRIDKEYADMIGGDEGGRYSETDALMILWDKYPSMRSYILDKYVAYRDDLNFAE